MRVEIDGTVSPLEHKIIHTAIRYYAERLMPKSVRDELTLFVEIDEDKEDLGLCVNDDMFDEDGEFIMIPDKSRTFTIELRQVEDVGELASTIGHEMVHVKQYAMEELTYQPIVGKGKRADVDVPHWYGVPWKPKRGEDKSYHSPWEIEAYGREVGLYIQFRNYWNRKFGKEYQKLEGI